MSRTTEILNTNDIVASNLTIAYCATVHPQLTDQEQIVEIYERFKELLRPKGDRYDRNEGGSWGYRQG
jgi:hypothetical protein